MIEDWIGGVLLALTILGLYEAGKQVYQRLGSKEDETQ